MKTFYLLAAAFLFSAFAKAQHTQDTTSVDVPKIYVKAYQGENITLGNVNVKLIKVLEDSRCPKGVDCIWAGQAKVLVEIIDSKGSVKIEEHTILPLSQEKLLISQSGLDIKLTGLLPYPDSAQKIAPKDYFITLDVHK